MIPLDEGRAVSRQCGARRCHDRRARPDADDGRGRRRQAEGAVGDRLRRRPHESERQRDRASAARRSTSHRAGHVHERDGARVRTSFFPPRRRSRRDGTFMNAERRVQRVRKAIEPPGEAKPDWEIICDVARRWAKASLRLRSPRRSGTRSARVWPAGRGITYARLESGGLQWPCPTRITGHDAPAHRCVSRSGSARPAAAHRVRAHRRNRHRPNFPSCSSPAAPSTSSTPAP